MLNNNFYPYIDGYKGMLKKGKKFLLQEGRQIYNSKCICRQMERYKQRRNEEKDL